MLSAKQGNYLVPFLKRGWYDAVLDWGLNPGGSRTRSQHYTTIEVAVFIEVMSYHS